MDINGAKALKQRLGPRAADAALPSASVDVSADAPPVFHWFGVSQPPSSTPPAAENEPRSGPSLFRRLGA